MFFVVWAYARAPEGALYTITQKDGFVSGDCEDFMGKRERERIFLKYWGRYGVDFLCVME